MLWRDQIFFRTCAEKMENLKDCSVGKGGTASWWALHARRRRSERGCEGQLREKDCGECTHKRTVSSAEDIKERKLVGDFMAQPRDHEEACKLAVG